jgi:lipoprotein NlpI
MSTDQLPAGGRIPRARRRSPFLLVLVLAGLFYVGMIVCLADSQSGDAFGRALAAAFGALLGLVAWILLGILLWIAAVKGQMPRLAGVIALVLLPLSAVSAAIAIDANSGAAWYLPFLPMLLPPPIAAFAIWARFPALHRSLPPQPTAIVLLGAVLALTIAPLPTFVADQVRRAEVARQEEAARKAAEAAETERRRENLARFEKLTLDSPLWEWAPFIGKTSELDDQAVAGAKALTHRQADAEEALRRGLGFPLVIYDRIDLDATPAFCTAAGDFLRRNAAAHPAASAGGEFSAAAQDYEPYLEGIEWLTRKKCDLDDAIERTREAVGAYRQTGWRDSFLAILAWRRGNGFYNREDHDRAIAEYDVALRLSPGNSQFFFSRGNAYYNQQQYDRAIADYSEAIRLNNGYSAAWDSRANAYYFKGDMEQALRDYDAAIEHNPGKANAYNNRANVFIRNGQFDRAVQDYDKALELDPKFRVALGGRGRARFNQADYAPAADDLAAALALKPKDPYTALWLYLARLRAGQPARDRLREEAAKLDRDDWPWPVVAAFLGDSDTATILADVRRSTADDRAVQQCEAEFYFGAQSTAQGDTATARDLLQQAAAICPGFYIEAIGAKYELARLPP